MRARAVVNATGPWVADIVGRVAGSSPTRKARLVKGCRVMVPKLWRGEHACLVRNADKRVIPLSLWRATSS